MNDTTCDLTETWSDEAATIGAAQRFARCLQQGDVIALIGDLGAGKTRFVKAVGTALGASTEAIHSPTFTLILEYSAAIPVRHCDAYRLRHPDEFADLGLDELFAMDGVAFVEWADRVTPDLPRDHLVLSLAVTGPESRSARWSATGPRSRALLDHYRATP